MKMLDLVNRTPVPAAWLEGEKIPWNEPGFSARMLKEHLNQNHDAASRRMVKIERHVAWIHETLLMDRPGCVLDLACGPGLYTSRLARAGHRCFGIDFSPASIAYASAYVADQAEVENLCCAYLCEDIRRADFRSGYDLVMLIFGEFNVFKVEDACSILNKAWAALKQGGKLLLELQTYDSIKQGGEVSPAWNSSHYGLFSDKPHLNLRESFWDAQTETSTTRYYIIDASSGWVSRYAESSQAYTDQRLGSMLSAAGFVDPQFFPSLMGAVDETQTGLFAVVAHKAPAASD